MSEPLTTNFCGLEMNVGRRLALEKLFTRISDVASFPATAQKLLELTSNENANTDEIRELIQTDPALTANMLRRVNSSYYSLNSKVADVRTAVNMLGLREIRNLAITVFLAKFSEKPSDHRMYKRRCLWDHCVAVGTVAKLIAKLTNKAVPEEAYIAGLLHDIGFILCDQFLRNHFCRVIDNLSDTVPTPEIENSVLTFDHAMLGGFVAQKWNFPESAAHAILFHHRTTDYTGAHVSTLNCVVLANYLCSRAGYLSLGLMNLPLPEPAVFQGLAIDPASLDDLQTEMQSKLQAANIGSMA